VKDAQKTAGYYLGKHRRHGVAELNPLIRGRTAKDVVVAEGLEPCGLAQADGTYLGGMDVAVSILGKMRDNRF
jgi:hypothetical protein